jgi:hypothetical protein
MARLSRGNASRRRSLSDMPVRPFTRETILKRINEIDRKFEATEPGLHSMLAKVAREREQLVALSNKKFGTQLKHEWR